MQSVSCHEVEHNLVPTFKGMHLIPVNQSHSLGMWDPFCHTMERNLALIMQWNVMCLQS